MRVNQDPTLKSIGIPDFFVNVQGFVVPVEAKLHLTNSNAVLLSNFRQIDPFTTRCFCEYDQTQSYLLKQINTDKPYDKFGKMAVIDNVRNREWRRLYTTSLYEFRNSNGTFSNALEKYFVQPYFNRYREDIYMFVPQLSSPDPVLQSVKELVVRNLPHEFHGNTKLLKKVGLRGALFRFADLFNFFSHFPVLIQRDYAWDEIHEVFAVALGALVYDSEEGLQQGVKDIFAYHDHRSVAGLTDFLFSKIPVWGKKIHYFYEYLKKERGE